MKNKRLRLQYTESRSLEERHTTAASSSGYGSGASARSLYALRNADSEALDRRVRLSISD